MNNDRIFSAEKVDIGRLITECQGNLRREQNYAAVIRNMSKVALTIKILSNILISTFATFLRICIQSRENACKFTSKNPIDN